MAFVWSMLFGYLYIWALKKRSFKWAFLWLILAVGNHLVIMGPIIAVYTAWAYWRQPELRRSLCWIWGFAIILLIPLAWYTFTSPTVGENSSSSIALTTLWTLIPRGGLFFTPLIITWFASYCKLLARVLVGLPVAIALVGLVLWMNISHDQFSGLFSNASDYYQTYFESPYYTPGAVYRVVEKNREEQGQYYFIRHGAILANEFFYESFHRQNWTEASYEKYLSEKKVDFVLMRADYLRHYHTNEGQILEELRAQGLAKIIYQDPQGRFSVYDVRAVSSAIEEHTCVEFVIG